MLNKDLADYKRKYLLVYKIPACVTVDDRFPLGSIECYCIPRASKYASAVNSDILFYITFDELKKLEDKNGTGACVGRTEWGPYCMLHCAFYRVMNVRVLSDDDQISVKEQIYGGDMNV